MRRFWGGALIAAIIAGAAQPSSARQDETYDGSVGVNFKDRERSASSVLDVNATQCVKAVLGLETQAFRSEAGVLFFGPHDTRVFARSMDCMESGLRFEDMVIIEDRSAESLAEVGSAIKADTMLISPAAPKTGCGEHMARKIEAVNLRWFNWDNMLDPTGEGAIEIINTGRGRDVQIRTSSHMRMGTFLWQPTNGAPSPCGMSGTYSLTKLDVRYPDLGNATKLLSDSVNGDVSIPFGVEDARKIIRPGSFSSVFDHLTMQDSGSVQMLSSEQYKLEISADPKSALPWSLLVRKYGPSIVMRDERRDVISRLLPPDLSNTLYFTKASLSMSLSRANISPSMLFPLRASINFSAGAVSSVFATISAKAQLRDGDAAINTRVGIEAIGDMDADFKVAFQLFNKDILKAVMEERADLGNKAGPGLSSFRIRLTDKGLTSAFTSIMGVPPSSWVMNMAGMNESAWRQVHEWLLMVEQGKTADMTMTFDSPKLMIPGFWEAAMPAATIDIMEVME